MSPAKPQVHPPGAFLILEGGGAKGLAHIGALAALKERDLAVYGVAGASAGSIMAALTAAGYKPDELYTPAQDGKPPAGLFATLDWIKVLDAKTWARFQSLRDGLAMLKRAWGAPFLLGWIFGPLYTLWFLLTRARFVLNAWRGQGVFNTAGFRAQLATWLKDRVPTRHPDSGPTFGELAELRRFSAADGTGREVPLLKIVAVDVNARVLVVYDEEHTPDTAIADAVAASIAIPVFFAPPVVRSKIIGRDGSATIVDRKSVDGGLISNFPAWLFLEEAVNCPAYTEIIGITLAEEDDAPTPPGETIGPVASAFRYLMRIITTALFGAQRLQNARVDRLHEIAIPTRIGTLGFDAGDTMKDATYTAGRDTARQYLDRHLKANPLDVLNMLEETAALLAESCGALKADLTVSLARPNNAGTHLIVVNGVNLDPEHVGARLGMRNTLAGRAFKTGHIDTFQRATAGLNGNPGGALRIPAHMTDMICLPLLRRKPLNNPAVADEAPLGVLSISSRVAFIANLRNNDSEGDYVDLLLNDLAETLSDLLDTGKPPQAPPAET